MVEFTVTHVEKFDEKSDFTCSIAFRTTYTHPKAGFCRAPGAVIEALIAVTRIGIVDNKNIEETIAQSRVAVDKTGGSDEATAMSMIEEYYERNRQ